MEKGLIELYRKHIGEVLSLKEIKCEVLGSTGIETARSRQGGVFEEEDFYNELNLLFTWEGIEVFIKLSNGNMGCDCEDYTKSHSHTSITVDGKTVEHTHGWKYGEYTIDDNEKEEFLTDVGQEIPDYVDLVSDCLEIVWSKTKELRM